MTSVSVTTVVPYKIKKKKSNDYFHRLWNSFVLSMQSASGDSIVDNSRTLALIRQSNT